MERGTETSSHCISNYVVSPNVGRMEPWARQLLGLGGFVQKLSSSGVKLRQRLTLSLRHLLEVWKKNRKLRVWL